MMIEKVKDVWSFLCECKSMLHLFLTAQRLRDRMYKRDGEYTRQTLSLDEELAVFWPAGKRYPAPITPAIRLAETVRSEAATQFVQEHPDEVEIIELDGAKITLFPQK
jgi:hypothetical protein